MALCLMALAFIPALAHAQTFPKLSGQVVDAANLLDDAQEISLTAKLSALARQSGRQVVVATIPDLEGYEIDDYGYRLGRAWGIGDKQKNDGALLIVAPHERKVRIEVGYGLEGILTDALSSRIIRNEITPRFKAGDMAGGISAGAEAIATLLALPPDQARAQALAAEKEAKQRRSSGGDIMSAFWGIVITIVILSFLFGGRGGRRYGRGGSGPVVIWGPGLGSGWGGGSSWGSGSGSDWGGGGGGFSGGGGSFGGGGASGDW
ncbi:TPM domain-containing protein [Sphingobium aquiterrae]|uniref:TPM domain-containing protein n=1 Tax=Sphingobium aquiterrae TaxID=2038656 RepID=UPI00301B37E9